MAERPWSRTAEGLRLDVRMTPRAGTDRLEGVRTLSNGSTVLAARVRAAPEDGKANAALLLLVARALGVPAFRCTLVAGARSRMKSVSIAGDPGELEPRLDALCAAAKD